MAFTEENMTNHLQNKTFSIHTLGCKVNACESEAIREMLRGCGCTERAFGEAVDLVIVNQAVADVCQRAATHADGMHFCHIVGYGAQRRHRTERHAFEVHVKSGDDHPDTPVGEFIAHAREVIVEKLCLIDAYLIFAILIQNVGVEIV